jgi:hypothetical protein
VCPAPARGQGRHESSDSPTDHQDIRRLRNREILRRLLYASISCDPCWH